jgi:hypothetical protein
MNITAEIFAAYLKCQTKCFLRAHGDAGSGNEYADWVHTESDTYRAEGLRRLTAGFSPDDCVTDASALDSIRAAKWRVAADVNACAENLESSINETGYISGRQPSGTRNRQHPSLIGDRWGVPTRL